MISRLKTSLSQSLTNARGWRTNRKIVVIESDDWGSIRMPNKHAISKLEKQGFKVEKCGYMQNDSLESNEDMECLFDFIESRKRKPVITANFLTANPDFGKIRESYFEQYFYEPLDKTLANYPNHDRVKMLWIKGLKNGYFIPQLHGREHLNIQAWLKDLQDGNKETLYSFDLNLYGVSANTTKVPRPSYQAAFGRNSGTTLEKKNILTEASKAFVELFGYSSKTFIAPNYTWDSDVEAILHPLGVTHFQGADVQRYYNQLNNSLNVKRHFLGEKNQLSQKYLIRNVSFEPFSDQNKDWISSTLQEINNAFFWKKPAIISMHRVNFIGSINPDNREHNLKLLNALLDEIEIKWPEVEYMSSDKLAELI